MEMLPVVNAFKPGLLKTKKADAIQAYFNRTHFINNTIGSKEIIDIQPIKEDVVKVPLKKS